MELAGSAETLVPTITLPTANILDVSQNSPTFGTASCLFRNPWIGSFSLSSVDSCEFSCNDNREPSLLCLSVGSFAGNKNIKSL
jgi:hypothetical protein